MDEIYLSILIIALIGSLLVFVIFYFGNEIIKNYNCQKSKIELPNNIIYTEKLGEICKSCSSDTNERRNEFWTMYGQILIAIFLILALTILLLTKSIKEEAGLPILSAISGFAIAKGASIRSNNNPNKNSNNPDNKIEQKN